MSYETTTLHVISNKQVQHIRQRMHNSFLEEKASDSIKTRDRMVLSEDKVQSVFVLGEDKVQSTQCVKGDILCPAGEAWRWGDVFRNQQCLIHSGMHLMQSLIWSFIHCLFQ